MQSKFFKKLAALALAGCLVCGEISSVAFSDGIEGASAEAIAESTAAPTAEPAAEPTVEPAMPIMEDIPLISENVQAVQKMIDALPSASALNEENMAAAYDQTEAAYDAYLALNAEEQAQITGAEKFAALFAVFNAQVATLETEYSITISVGTGNGTVVPDKTMAQAGDTVTLTVAPANNYALNTLIVTDGKGNPVETTAGANGQYTFTMPNAAVTVAATFTSAVSNYIITIPSSVSLNGASSMTITAEIENLAEGQSVVVQAASANGGKLKFGENEIAYSFAQSLNFIQSGSQHLALTIGANETNGKPAGTYTDTLNFTVRLSADE